MSTFLDTDRVGPEPDKEFHRAGPAAFCPGASVRKEMRRLRLACCASVAAALSLLLASSPSLIADGGITIGQIDQDGLRVTVFAAPVPIRAGLLDVSFLVQEIPSNLPVGDASIRCSVLKLSPPAPDPVRLPAWCAAITPGTGIPATPGHSGNKLLSGAYIPIPEPGRWELSVNIARGAGTFTGSIPLEVSPSLPPFSTWWPVIALAPLGILLYIWRARLLTARRGSRSG